MNNDVPSRSNVRARINSQEGLVWFEAKRDIAPGNELTFTYTDEPLWMYSLRTAGMWLLWLCLVLSYIGGFDLSSAAISAIVALRTMAFYVVALVSAALALRTMARCIQRLWAATACWSAAPGHRYARARDSEIGI